MDVKLDNNRRLVIREEISDRERELRKNDRPEFLICRRLDRTPWHLILPWERFDKCRACGTDVIYDSKFSDLSMPHVCAACAAQQVESLRHGALDPMTIDDSKLDDAEQFARIVRSISQSKAGEHRR